MTRHALSIIATIAFLAAVVEGCHRETPAPVVSAKAVPEASATAAAEALDLIDIRTPLPLPPMMANHQ